jgi:hypothetical protein
MPVNSVTSPIDLIASSRGKLQQEQQEVHQSGRDASPDNDSDDQTTQAAKPTVNTSGQTIGTIINTKA